MPNLAAVISVLIPTYNHVVVSLVQELRKQIMQTEIEAEIIILDDDSIKTVQNQNRDIANFSGVIYDELPANIGRSAIRNELADRASYPYLLYLDADSAIVRDDFLGTYARSILDAAVLVGGRLYSSQRPSKEHLLHWRYGRIRETRSLDYRKKRPASFFHSNNILLPKSLNYDFPEASKGYGYEDLALGQKLKQEGVNIVHIDNPVMHSQLDTNHDFIRKHQQAISNLAVSLRENISLGTRLESFYLTCRKVPFGSKVLDVLKGLDTFLLNRLTEGSGSLLYLDLYRLLLLHEVYQSKAE